MDAPTFTLLTQKLGIYQRGIGYGVALTLAEIAKAPIPINTGIKNGDRSPNAMPLAIGPLIKRGLVCFVRESDKAYYRITKAGQDWLDLIQHHNLLA